MTATCPVCAEPIRDQAALCRKCAGRLERELGDVPALAAEVQTTRLRLSRTGGQPIGGGHSSERPLPFDDRPVARAKELLGVLRTWGQFVVDHEGRPCPRDTVPDLAKFLLGSVGWLRRRDEAPAAYDELTHSIGRMRASVDRRPERRYWGACGSVDYLDSGVPDPESVPCPADLYARPGVRQVTCEVCGTVHELDEDRRRWLQQAVEDQLTYAADMSRALSGLARPIPEATIRSWAERGRLVAHGADDRGRPLYRVGDVIELLAARAAREGRTGRRAG